MKFIEGLGWVEDDVTSYPNWFESFVKEKMSEKEKEEKPCEHGWVKTEREPFCHYCERCCF